MNTELMVRYLKELRQGYQDGIKVIDETIKGLGRLPETPTTNGVTGSVVGKPRPEPEDVRSAINEWFRENPNAIKVEGKILYAYVHRTMNHSGLSMKGVMNLLREDMGSRGWVLIQGMWTLKA